MCCLFDCFYKRVISNQGVVKEYIRQYLEKTLDRRYIKEKQAIGDVSKFFWPNLGQYEIDFV